MPVPSVIAVAPANLRNTSDSPQMRFSKRQHASKCSPQAPTPMIRTALTALAFTSAIALLAPISQAAPITFGLSNGQPDTIHYPFGRSAEALDSTAGNSNAEL